MPVVDEGEVAVVLEGCDGAPHEGGEVFVAQVGRDLADHDEVEVTVGPVVGHDHEPDVHLRVRPEPLPCVDQGAGGEVSTDEGVRAVREALIGRRWSSRVRMRFGTVPGGRQASVIAYLRCSYQLVV